MTAWKIVLQPVILDLLLVFHKLCKGRNRDAHPLEQPQQESGINSLSCPPFLGGTSICCWLRLSSRLRADDQQLAWEHNPDFEQCNCHVGRDCPCVQRPKDGSQREHSQDCFRPFNYGPMAIASKCSKVCSPPALSLRASACL